jgi:hypothetical protein
MCLCEGRTKTSNFSLFDFFLINFCKAQMQLTEGMPFFFGFGVQI